ncbi:MAG: ATP-dependent sacrificial sulfur transferase LarE, partial [Planctomycetota bacterium]
LESRLGELPSLLVALSGGVDSAALLGAAARALRGRVAAATTSSPAVPSEEIEEAKATAARFSVPHHVVPTNEMEDPRYRRNAGDRCYFCRREMYGALHALAAREGLAFVADGLQADDAPGDRPGVRAAGEMGVLHPLFDAGIGKADARRLARGFGLTLFDKPAQPCLSSRLPKGVEVTVERLERVHRAEKALKALGFREVRVRCEDARGRVEIGAPELPLARERVAEIEAAVLAAGFRSARLDPLAYASTR